MNDQQEQLLRYDGLYQVGWKWQDGMDISRFLEVKAVGDHLTVQYETITVPIGSGFLHRDDPRIERQVSDSDDLKPTGEFTYQGEGSQQCLRFSLSETGDTESVVVIRDGETSDSCPRWVPLPEETPGRRERFEWFDLGHPTLCMTAKDAEALVTFYERLGFVRHPKAPGNVRQGWR
jgi:hypothetical protein|tara:strand:+ start:5049 stop:5579 length:531 start_codon:yes stop_codon:yes gene_type:complete